MDQYRSDALTGSLWIELESTTPDGDLTIVLIDANGQVVRRWTNSADPATIRPWWSVFDGNGGGVRVAPIGEPIDAALPSGPTPRVPKFARTAERSARAIGNG